MANKLLALSYATLALVMVSAVSSPTDARSGGHSFSGGSRSFSGGNFRPHSGGNLRLYSGGNLRPYSGANVHSYRLYGHSHHRHHRHRHIFIGGPFLYGVYDYGYGYGDCYWLRRRAIYTGGAYWWSRYRACLGGYGY